MFTTTLYRTESTAVPPPVLYRASQGSDPADTPIAVAVEPTRRGTAEGHRAAGL